MKVQVALLSWACAGLCLISYTAGFSHGAGHSACSDMRPKHISTQPQNPKSNYISVYTNKSSYLPGDNMPVTVRSTRDFMGFLIQARRLSDDRIAGTFVVIPPGSKLLTCFEDGDTVTHSDKSLKRNLSFVWRAPDQPIGNIKFFVSIVQSYFVYWARIESAVVSDQMQNNLITATSEEKSDLASTPSQNPFFNSTGGMFLAKAASLQIEKFAQSVKPTAVSQIGFNVTDSPQTELVSGEGLGFHSNGTERGRYLSRPSLYSTTQSGGKASPKFSLSQDDHILEPSLTLKNSEADDRSLSYILEEPTQHSTEDSCQIGILSKLKDAFKCSYCCPVIVQVDPSNRSLDVTRPLSSAAPALLSTVWYADFTPLDAAQLWEQLDNRNGLDVPPLTSKSPPEGRTQKALANFLQQAENYNSGQEVGKAGKNPPQGVTHPAEVGGWLEKGGNSPRRSPVLTGGQVGILLGCSAALGMVLAAALRYLHAQYCHKRTEVSFSEPGNGIIRVRESGELVQVRKIRENSFVLVQAEYNVITPPSGVGKLQQLVP
ncbi:reelin domain-containing protein 1-like [Latimeria chalumnae]